MDFETYKYEILSKSEYIILKIIIIKLKGKKIQKVLQEALQNPLFLLLK